MLSRPLALGLVVAACVVAAGGGAYIATLQHARSDSAMAASQVPGPSVAPQASAVPAAAPSSAAPPAASQLPSSGVATPPAQPSPDDLPAVKGVPQGPMASAREPGRATSGRAVQPARPTSAGSSSRAHDGRQGVPAPPAAGAEPSSTAPAPGVMSVPQVPAAVAAPGDTPSREQPRAEPEKTWLEVTVPSESVLGLQLETPLSSETAQVEDRVDARVTRDVRVNGQVAIPSGTHAIGTVMLVERGGKIRDRARIGIRFNTLILPDASRVPVSTEMVYREGEAPSTSSSAKIGGGAIGGALIGAILGGGKGAAIGSGIGAAGGTAAAMAGDRRPVVLPAGTPLSVRTQAPVTVTVEK